MARISGCILILITVGILAFGVVCFLFAMSKPLLEVNVVELKSVIATEQELMLDIVVQAINPNIVPISVTDLDINLFARSKYVGSEKWWREHGQDPTPEPPRAPINATAKRDPLYRRSQLIRRKDTDVVISDPPSELPSAGQTMLLGHVLHFDNSLSFDGSFWRRQLHYSTGQVRLSKPGNHTEAGGTERWERVLKHDFDLILRGVLRYSIPLTGKSESPPIKGEITIDGNGGKDSDGGDSPPDPGTGLPDDGDTWLAKQTRT